LAGRQTTSGIVEGGTHSTDTLMVCPPGDTTSTEVGLGTKIDLALIFFVEEEKRDAETESFLSVAISRASVSAVSRRRSLSFSLRHLDLDFSRSEPQESNHTKDIERDWRRDSQILIE
jgi:hypothetical protein